MANTHAALSNSCYCDITLSYRIGLDKVQEGLADATVIGVTYILAWSEVAEFEKLDKNTDVILAEVGFMKEISEERAKGNVAWGNPPPNLYSRYNEFQ